MPRSPANSAPATGKVRLQRVLAAAGVAARRVCEEMITQGRVEVNGTVVRTLPVFVDPAVDHVVVDGRGLPRSKPRGRGSHAGLAGELSGSTYIMLHKPARVLSTTRDDGGRRTVMDMVQHPAAARLFPVGRLDFHCSGLVLLTNDGEMANRLTHPRHAIEKIYLAHVKGVLDAAFVADVERGMNSKQQRAAHERAAEETPSGWGPRRTMARSVRKPGHIAVSLSRSHEDKTVLEVRLVDTGPRSVPDMLSEAGLRVVKLARVGIGPLALRGVGLGRWRELDTAEVKALRQACGLIGPTSKPASMSAKQPSGSAYAAHAQEAARE